MSYTNHNILPRALSYEEKENRKKGIYDSFANYLVYCPKCKHVAKTNMCIYSAPRLTSTSCTSAARSAPSAATATGRSAIPSERSRAL